jgi:general secretion pathway protein C
MASYLSWGANAVLFAVGCFVVADAGNAIFAAALAPTPGEIALDAEPPPERDRSWEEHQIILSRNLFNASTLAPATLEEPDENADLEATQLPLRLLGTVASADPEVARAAIEDTDQRKRLVVRVGDRIKDKATVLRIERRRVVLAENDARRELALDDETPEARTTRRTPSRRTARANRRDGRGARARLRQLDQDKFAVPKSSLEDTLRDPSNLFQQARILPKFEDGQMLGMQVSAIKSGSLLEEVGLQNGDIISELNGIAIDSPQATSELMQELSGDARSFNVVVQGADGEPRVIEFETPDE